MREDDSSETAEQLASGQRRIQSYKKKQQKYLLNTTLSKRVSCCFPGIMGPGTQRIKGTLFRKTRQQSTFIFSKFNIRKRWVEFSYTRYTLRFGPGSSIGR